MKIPTKINEFSPPLSYNRLKPLINQLDPVQRLILSPSVEPNYPENSRLNRWYCQKGDETFIKRNKPIKQFGSPKKIKLKPNRQRCYLDRILDRSSSERNDSFTDYPE
ncbi:hypothetical protein GWI33_013029, partial [Rhynchophorus ferrugineus]